MKRFFIEIMYDGANYHGWQIQPNSITVQEKLEKSISTILNKKISVVGAGRTDAGVHAKQFFAHFDFENTLCDNNFIYRLNSILPNDIYIKSISVVKDNAHSRFDAVWRTYEYIISQSKNPFLIKKALGLKSGSSVPNKDKVGKITVSQLEEIVKTKEPDLTAGSMNAAMRTIAGTARSMGVDVPEEIYQDDQGDK